MNFSSSAAMSAAFDTDVTGLAMGAESNCSSSAANGRMTAGPVTTMISSSASSAVDKNTCSWSLVASTGGQLNSMSSGKHARASRLNRSWQTKKNRPTPPAIKEDASHDSKGVPMIFCSIIGREKPVLGVSSGIKITADSPAKALTHPSIHTGLVIRTSIIADKNAFV